MARTAWKRRQSDGICQKTKSHVEKKKVVRFKLRPDREKMSQRMCISEQPFGTIKRAMGEAYFWLKGKQKVGGDLTP